MNREKEAKDFLKELQKTNPHFITEFQHLLKDFVAGKGTLETVMLSLKENIRSDVALVEKLNACLVESVKLNMVSDSDKKQFCNYIIAKMYPLCPAELESFAIATIQSSLKILDKLVFFSMEELVEEYLQFLQNDENGQNLGKFFIKSLKQVLEEFLLKWNNKEDLYENGDTQTPEDVLDHKTHPGKKEQQIFDLIEKTLSPQDFQTFMKTFQLYR